MVTDITTIPDKHFLGGKHLALNTGDSRDLRTIMNQLIATHNLIDAVATAGNIVQRDSNADVILPATPTAANAATPKAWVQALVAATSYALEEKPSCDAASTGNLTLSAPQTVDGIAVIAGNRVLAKNQSTPAENGIWIVAAAAWTRALDMAAGADAAGNFVSVEAGTANVDKVFICTNNAGAAVVGTDNLVFADWSAVTDHALLKNLTTGDPHTQYELKASLFSATDGVRGEHIARAASTIDLALTGAQTIDAIACIAGDRVLAKNQASADENGLWVVAAGAWARATDMAVGATVSGALVYVSEGTAGGDKVFVCTNDAATDVVGTDNLVIVDISTLGAHAAATAVAGHAGGAGDHTHQTTGAEGMTLDHGLAIEATSLLDDDHTQYERKVALYNATDGMRAEHVVRVASTVDLTLSAPQTIDGVAVIATERVLAKNQATPAENGIWVCAAGAWTRATDMPIGATVAGALVSVSEGTASADQLYQCTNNAAADVVATNDLVFTAMPVTNAVTGVAAGYLVARGTATLLNGGGGTLVVATGLTAIVSATCTLAQDPVVTECMWISQTWAAGNLTVKGWKPTAVNDATPAAATPPGGNTKVDWIAIGT